MADVLLSVRLRSGEKIDSKVCTHSPVNVKREKVLENAVGILQSMKWRNWLLMISCNKKMISVSDVIHSVHCNWAVVFSAALEPTTTVSDENQ